MFGSKWVFILCSRVFNWPELEVIRLLIPPGAASIGSLFICTSSHLLCGDGPHMFPLVPRGSYFVSFPARSIVLLAAGPAECGHQICPVSIFAWGSLWKHANWYQLGNTWFYYQIIVHTSVLCEWAAPGRSQPSSLALTEHPFQEVLAPKSVACHRLASPGSRKWEEYRRLAGEVTPVKGKVRKQH